MRISFGNTKSLSSKLYRLQISVGRAFSPYRKIQMLGFEYKIFCAIFSWFAAVTFMQTA